MNNLLLKKEEIKTPTLLRILICFYFFLCFFEPYLNGVLGSVGKYYIFVVILALLLFHKKFYFQSYHVCFILWFAYKILTAVWTPNETVFGLHILSHIGMTALLLAITIVHIDKKTLWGIVYTTFLSSFAIGVLSLFFSEPYLYKNQSRMVLTLFNCQIDPNNQAVFLLMGISIAIYFLFYLKKHRVLSLIVLLINTYSIFLTGSRGGLVSFIAMLLIILLVTERKMSFKEVSYKLGLVLFGVVLLYYITKNFLPIEIFERIFTFAEYEGGSERIIIWKRAFRLLSEKANWIFGAGWGSLYGYAGGYDAGHNTYISMLCDVGIIGSILFFVPIFSIASYLLKEKQVLPLLLLVSGLIPCFFLDAINKRFFWNPIIFAILWYNLYKKIRM